ncbi:MAG: IS4 family transposase [Elusimicrobiota bacterium]
MSQLQTFIPRHHFDTLVKSHFGDRYVKNFTCWNQFTVMLYAQVSGKDSLRDIQNSLTVQSLKLYHLGLQLVKRSTLADANQTRHYGIYENLFYKLLERCKNITPKHKFKFKNPLYIIDATVIDLCLTTFDWAKFRTTKGAIKLHCQLDHSGQIPTFMVVTDAKQHEITTARSFFDIVADSIYCVDKGYIDYTWLYSIEKSNAFFVTRAKDNIKYRVIGQHSEPKKESVISDEIIAFTGFYQQQNYPKELRLINYYDRETDKLLVFITNNFKLAASTIARVYKARWQIEVFFKWIKQNLKIKTFLGTSKNAVLTQVWIAMCYYLLLTYIKYQSKYKSSIFYLHRIIKTTILERLNLIDLLNMNDKILSKVINNDHQGQLALNF